MLQEISRTFVPITRIEEASLSWHNSVVTVRTEKEIYFFEFSNNLDCLDKKIDFISHSITDSKSSPLTGYVPNHFTTEGVSNIDYTEMILDPSLWPHNRELVNDMTNIADCQWSPVGLMPNSTCALAVLNNIGNVDIYGKGRLWYTIILNLSDIIKESFLSLGKLKKSKTLRKLKKLAYTLETGAITWCPNCVNNSGLFVTAQKDGQILFWVLEYKNKVMKPEPLGVIETDFGELVNITWIPKNNETFILICSNIQGEIYALDCFISDSIVLAKSLSPLWPQKDKMVTKIICYKTVEDKIVLLCNKHRHLLAILIDKDCQVIGQYVKNINDYRITDITSNDYAIFLTTVNCKIYKIMPKVQVSDLDFDLELIETNDSFSSYEMYNIAFSSNSVLSAVVLKNRNILHRQRTQKFFDVVFFYNTDHKPDELTLLLENPAQRLTNYLDCIELLRYKTFKTKILPQIDLNELFQEADKNIFKLKLYLVFLHFFLGLEKQIRNKSRKMLPELSLNAVKEKILALHAGELITEVHEYRKNGEEMLDYLQLDTYNGATKYLEYYCEKYKRDIGEFLDSKELVQQSKSIPKTEDRKTCQSCDEDIHGFTCNNGHFNMFCSLTFTPIEGYEYLSCRSCNSTARIELYSNNPVCIFCDQYLSDGR